MKNIIDNIAKLVDLKSFVTLAITGAMIYGFISNKIDSKDFVILVTMVYTFYFAKKESDKK